jgi:hypothetical protein
MVDRARQDALLAVQRRAHQRSDELRTHPELPYKLSRRQLKSTRQRQPVPVYTTAESLHQYAILAARNRAIRRLQRAPPKSSSKGCSKKEAVADENQPRSCPCIRCGCTCSMKKDNC